MYGWNHTDDVFSSLSLYCLLEILAVVGISYSIFSMYLLKLNYRLFKCLCSLHSYYLKNFKFLRIGFLFTVAYFLVALAFIILKQYLHITPSVYIFLSLCSLELNIKLGVRVRRRNCRTNMVLLSLIFMPINSALYMSP